MVWLHNPNSNSKPCVALYHWILTNNKEHVYIKYNLKFLFFDDDDCVKQESSHTHGAVESRKNRRKLNFRPNSRSYIALKTHATHMAKPLHSRNAYSPLVTATPTHFCVSGITPMHISFFLVVTLLILTITGCICQLHPLGSSPVKAVYHSWTLMKHLEKKRWEPH